MGSKIELVPNTFGFVIYVNGIQTKQIIGESGGYRVIGQLDDFIYKADFRKEDDPDNPWVGRIQTAKEIAFYHKIDPEDKKYFPEIVEYGIFKFKGNTFAWLKEKFQKFTESSQVVSDKREKFYTNRILPLKDKYKLNDLSIGSNWGIRDKTEPFIYDFAFNNADISDFFKKDDKNDANKTVESLEAVAV